MRTVLSTSGGKDSCFTLLVLRGAVDSGALSHVVAADRCGPSSVAVVGAVSTASAAFERTSMHGTRKELVEQQAAAMGLPFATIPIAAAAGDAGASSSSSNADGAAATYTVGSYFEQFGAGLKDFGAGVQATHVAFGDLMLGDLRRTREEALSDKGSLKPLFPLWFGRGDADTAAMRHARSKHMAAAIIDSGIRAVVVNVTANIDVDPNLSDQTAAAAASPPGSPSGRLGPERFLGRMYDEEFLRDLPPWADPCGENGEFQTFVFDGPAALFPRRPPLPANPDVVEKLTDFERAAVPIQLGEKVLRGGMWYLDLTLLGASRRPPASPLHGVVAPSTIRRTVFISASRLVHTYEDEERADVMDDAVFFFGSKRSWIFPATDDERRESLRQPTRYLEFPEPFVDLILAKEKAGLVYWLKPDCSFKKVSRFFEGLGYAPLTLDRDFWCTRFDARAKGQFVTSGESVWKNIALGEHDYGATMELVYQSNPSLLHPVL